MNRSTHRSRQKLDLLVERKRCMICWSERRLCLINYSVIWCVSCEQFFDRMTNRPDPKMSCIKKDNKCSGRKCSYCRLQKCLRFGMASLDDWKTEPWEIAADESESKRKRLCMICIRKEKTSKIGGCDACCKNCRIFFKRMLKLSSPLAPCAEQNHPVLLCVHCHQQKCMDLGMGEVVRQDSASSSETPQRHI